MGKIKPQSNTLLFFQGDLTHSVNPVSSSGVRLSLVCEQYSLEDAQLEEISPFQIESRVNKVAKQKKKLGKTRSPR